MQAFFDSGIKRFSRITLNELRCAMDMIEKSNAVFCCESFKFENKNCIIWNDEEGLGEEVILHLHSGGYVTGSELTSAQFCKALSKEQSKTIICPDYPLCPEVTIPEIVQWCLRLIEDLTKKGVKSFTLTGVSAGANLASLIALGNAKLDIPFNIKSIHLITGHYQSDFETESANRYESGEESGLSKSMLLKLLDYAIGDHSIHMNDPKIFPLYSEELSDLPKTYIHVAKYDVLHDDSLFFYEKLLKEGVDVTYNEYESGFHAWTNYLLENQTLLEYAKANIFNNI